MKTLVTRITERGQVSVPSAVRKYLHLQPGMQICWEPVSDTECRVIVRQKEEAKGAKAMLGFASTFRSRKKTAAWMHKLREGEAD